MLRILSAAVLIPIVVGCVWFLSTSQLLIVAEAVLVLSFVEYAGLAGALGLKIPRVPSGVAAAAGCAAVALFVPAELPLLAALIAIGALLVGERAPAPGVLADISAENSTDPCAGTANVELLTSMYFRWS